METNEILSIMKEAKRLGIHSIKLPGLEILYGPEDQTGRSPKKIKSMMKPQDEDAIKALQETQLLMDDPVAYEEAMIDEQMDQPTDENQKYRRSQ